METVVQPGTLPVWALNGRPSASADAARLREIERISRLTPLERIAMALEIGRFDSDRHRGTEDPEDSGAR